MHRLSVLKQFLAEIGQDPKKSLSQNFLIDGNIVSKIADVASVCEGSLVLEIGPGPGALTGELLSRGCEVVAVDLDKTFAEKLPRLDFEGKLHVFNEDILKFDFDTHLTPLLNGRKVKVVANLPYHITTPILTKLVQMHEMIESLTCMMQYEVALRFTAEAGSKLFGQNSLFLQYHSKPKYDFKVPKNCFYPAPKVDSAIVTFTLFSQTQVKNEALFFEVVQLAFSQRRKTLKRSLRGRFESEAIESALLLAGKSSLARPEELDLQSWIKFIDAL